MRSLSVSNRRIRAPALHALASLGVAAIAALIVFAVWFPPPYAMIVGGLNLFLILVSVDVVMGPALTAVAADPRKPARTFLRDLAVIVALQVCALAYGLHVMWGARPVVLAFEVDRMRLLVAADIDPLMLSEAPPPLRKLSWKGPQLLAAARPATREETLRAIDLALAGLDISNVPKNWRSYETQSVSAWNAARVASELDTRYPSVHDELARIAAEAKTSVSELRFLPLVSRFNGGSVVLAPPDARVVGVLTVDGFL